ncbi:MAG: glycosyltransferase family 4 protein [Anaerolineae bacterium]|nr:glycosyltransferase family 4 protein [Anaerolineae bacterium]
MRVGLVTLDFPPFRSSGLTVYAESVAYGLARRGHAVTVVAARRPESDRVPVPPRPEPLAVVRLPVGRADWIGLGWQAARYLRAHGRDFDVVHFVDVHFAYACRGPYVASAFQSFRQRLTSHRGGPYCTTWRDCLLRRIYYTAARWLLERPAVRRARWLVAASESTRQEFITHYGADPARTQRVYLGVDPHRFDGLAPRAAARRQLGLPLDEPLLLFVGFANPRKGLEYLAEALRMMRTPVHLAVVGKWAPGYRERLAAALGERGAALHAPGYVPDADLLLYYAAADLFVLPTLLEGFGIPLVEAMAAGLPVVTTTGGSAGEVAGEGGLAVPPGDGAALAAALERVLNDPGLAEQLARAGQSRARTLFDESRTAAEIEAVYQKVTQDRGGGPEFNPGPPARGTAPP